MDIIHDLIATLLNKKKNDPDDSTEETEQEPNKLMTVILTSFIAFMVISAIFGLGLSVGYFSRTFPIIDCTDDPPAPKLHQIREWNEDRSAGVYILYKCNDLPFSPLTQVVVCNKTTQWQLIFSIPCSCRSDPQLPLGLSVYENSSDPTSHLSFMVTYKCNPSDCSPNALVLTCSASRNWQPIDEFQNRTSSPCNCSEFIAITEDYGTQNETVIMMKPETNTFGSSLQVFCTNTSLTLKEIYFCNYSAIWQKITYSNCLCSTNPPEPSPTELRVWENTIESRKIGSNITYHCTKNPKSYKFMTLTCDQTLTWINIQLNETDPCRQRHHVQNTPMSYQNASNWCKNQGGELARTFSLDDEALLQSIMMKRRLNCNSFYLAGKEDLSERWWWLRKKKLDPNSTYWSDGFPKGKQECVILIRSTLQWINEDCHKSHCYICEEKRGSCFKDQGRCVVMSYQVNFQYAQESCSNMGYSLITNFPNNQSQFKKLKEVLNQLSVVICPTFYTGLVLKHRIYRYDNGQALFVQALWKEPNSFDKECIVVKEPDFDGISGQNCNERSCSVCEFQGPDREQLVSVTF